MRPHKRKVQLAVMLGLLCLLALALALPALATSGTITILSVVSSSCTPGGFITIGVDIVVNKTGTHRVVRTITNPTRGTTTGAEATWTQGSGQFQLTAPVPANTQTDDDLVFRVALTDAAGAAYDHDWITLDCTTGTILEHGKPTATPSFTPTASGTPTGTLPTGTPAPGGTPTATLPAGGSPSGPQPTVTYSIDDLLKIPNSRGMLACGAFDVMGWGHKTIFFDLYPNCRTYAPALDIECMSQWGYWTKVNVHKLTYSLDGKSLSFISTQHGHCGLFPLYP